MSEKFCHTIAVWLIEKVAYRNNRAVEKICELLQSIRILMMLIFDKISNLLIGVKAVKLLFWEARIHTFVRTAWACPFILV